MASEFAIIIAISISQKRKRSRGVCLGRFRGLSTGRAMHSLHSHSIGQNSVTWLHLIARKAVTYSQARYPRRRGHGFSRVLMSGKHRKVLKPRTAKLGALILVTHYRSHWTSFSSENQNHWCLLLSTPQGDLRSKLEWNRYVNMHVSNLGLSLGSRQGCRLRYRI